MKEELFNAIKTMDEKTIINIIEKNPNCINWRDKYGATIMMHAAQLGSHMILEKIIDKCAKLSDFDINQKIPDTMMTPLMFAAVGGHIECVKLLIKTSGIDPDQTNLNGFTAIMLAAKHGHKNCVEQLLPISDLTKTDSMQKKTVLEWAQDVELKTLILNGCQPTAHRAPGM